MHLRRLTPAATIALVVCTTHLPTVSAQPAAPRDADAASRVAREADNPMRVIIEASKLKTRSKADGNGRDVPAAADKRAAREPKATPSAALAKLPAAVVTTPQAASQPAPSTTPATSAVTATAASAPPPQEVAKAAEAAPVAPVGFTPPKPQPKPQPLPVLPLKLVQLVEPSLSSMVVRRMRTDMEVVVGFTVNADGTVSDVAVRSSPMKALDDAVVEAVSQWRYEPIGEARTHAVQLVLRANN